MDRKLEWRRNKRWLLAIAGAGLTLLVLLFRLREAGTDEGSVAHAVITGIAVVVGGVLLSWLMLWVVRERMWNPELTPSNEVMGFIYATIGVVYSVIFAFVVVTTWQQFEEARSVEDAESHAVADLCRLLPGLPASEQEAARSTLTEYA